MKKYILIIIILIPILISCDNKSEKTDKIELETLKSQRESLMNEISSIDEKIMQLEENLGLIEQRKIPVNVSEVGNQNFDHFIKLYGEVESDKNAYLSPKVPGVVTSIFVKEGQKINKGTVLAQLDDRIPQTRLKEAKDSYDFVLNIYNKQKSIWEKKVGSEVEFLKAKNDKENLENRIAMLEEEIKNHKVIAPFDGIVDRKNINVGEMASPSIPLFNIVNNKNLKVRTDIADSYSSIIKAGGEVKVYFPDINSDTLNLKISAVSKAINTSNRTISVYIELPLDIQSELRPAMLAVTEIKTSSLDSAVIIPMNLVQRQGATHFVFVAKKVEGDSSYVATKKIIQLGKSYNNLVEIENGLSATDLLITVGHQNLTEGEAIKIM